MSAFDVAVIVVVGISLLVGLWRGLMFEVISLVGWIAAFFLAQWWAAPVGEWLPVGAPQAGWRYAAGFAIVFVAVAFGVGLIASLVRRLFAAVGLRPVDRLLGGVFGIARAAVALLALAAAVHLLALQQDAFWLESQTAPVLDAALGGLKPMLPQRLASLLP